MFKRARHQFGWLEKRKRKRGPEVWVWRYHEDVRGREGTKPAIVVGDVTQYPTKSEAWKAAEGVRLAVGNPVQSDLVTFGGSSIASYAKHYLSGRELPTVIVRGF